MRGMCGQILHGWVVLISSRIFYGKTTILIVCVLIQEKTAGVYKAVVSNLNTRYPQSNLNSYINVHCFFFIY